MIAPPENSAALLAMPTRDGTFDEQLRPRSTGQLHEHWFRRSDMEVQVCRHIVVRNACSDSSTTARFVNGDHGWSAPEGVMESICVTGTKVAETHNTSLERTRDR
jgi:hypothetical protein